MPASKEALFLSAVVRSADVKDLIACGLSQDMFRAFPDEYEWLSKAANRTGKMPGRTAFRSRFPKFTVYRTDDFELHAEEVREEHAKHMMKSAMSEAAKQISQGDIGKALQLMKEQMIVVAATVDKHNDADIFSSFDDILEETEHQYGRYQQMGSVGVPTGFETWDNMTGGCKPGELVVVAARLGVGKSWVLTRMAKAALAKGHTVQYDALEMTRHQVAMRMYDLFATDLGYNNIGSLDLISGSRFDINQFRKFLPEMDAKFAQDDGAFHVSDRNAGSLSSLKIAAQIQKNNPGIIVIDYIGLMLREAQGDWVAMGQQSSDLKATALDYRIPVVVAAQLNRDGQSREPADTDTIAQSDRIGQDADQVVTIAKWSDSVLKMKLAKNRHGKSGATWYAYFNPAKGIFRECTKAEAEIFMDDDKDAKDALQDVK